MDETKMEKNEQVLFHPINTNEQKIRKRVKEHITTHYGKYLFFGFFGGFVIFVVLRMVFDRTITGNQLRASEDESPEIVSLTLFDEAMALSHEKDLFFHQEGKIYTITGDSLFIKYDNMYHILDSKYHSSKTLKEKLINAKRFLEFIKVQDELFSTTEYTRVDKDGAFNRLYDQFTQSLQQLPVEIIENDTGSIETNSGGKTSSGEIHNEKDKK